MNDTTTREAWLNAAIDKMKPLFAAAGHEELPPIHVSVGFPSRGGLSRKKLTIGQCWSPKASGDGKTHNIFISPVLDSPDALQGVLSTLLHEVVHAVVGTEAAHGTKFSKLARLLGLEGKPTATHAGEALKETLATMAKELGEFPHSKLTPANSGIKKQGTRMLKVQCEECGYVVRTTQRWIEAGLPTCPCGTKMEEALE